MKCFKVTLLFFMQFSVFVSEIKTSLTQEETLAIIKKIKKNPIKEYVNIEKNVNYKRDLKKGFEDYCIFNYIQQHPLVFKNSLIELKTKSSINIFSLPFDNNNYYFEFSSRSSTQTPKKVGLIGAQQTQEIQLYDIIENKTMSFKLYPPRLSSNPKKRWLWGEIRKSGPQSTGKMSIYEWTRNGYQEVHDELLKEIVKSTEEKSEVAGSKSELKFRGSVLEDIISKDPPLWVIVVGKKNLSINCGGPGNKLFTLAEASKKWKKQTEEKSHSLQDDLNRVYIIEYDKKCGLLFYDYEQNKFFKIKSNIVWEQGKNTEFQKDSWLLKAIDHIKTIKIIDNTLLKITRFDGTEINVKINYTGPANELNNTLLIETYTEDEKEQPIISQEHIVKKDINQFNKDNCFSLNTEDGNLFIKYKNDYLNIDESYLIDEKFYLSKENLKFLNKGSEEKRICSFVKPINDNFYHIQVYSKNIHDVLSYTCLNLIFSKQTLIDVCNKIEEEKNKRIQKRKNKIESDYLKIEQQKIDNLQQKPERKEKNLTWIIVGGLGIAGISAVAALFWYWWKNKAKNSQ